MRYNIALETGFFKCLYHKEKLFHITISFWKLNIEEIDQFSGIFR